MPAARSRSGLLSLESRKIQATTGAAGLPSAALFLDDAVIPALSVRVAERGVPPPHELRPSGRS